MPPSATRLPSRRLVNLLGFMTCLLLLTFGYYLQYYQGLEPCPLCIFQRVGLAAVGLLFAIAAIHDPRDIGAKIYGTLIFLAAVAGGSVSVRHVWLQSLPPDQVPACGPGLDYMLSTFGVSDTITRVLRGSGECAEIGWTFMTLSIPMWTLIMFVLLGLTGLIRNWLRD